MGGADDLKLPEREILNKESARLAVHILFVLAALSGQLPASAQPRQMWQLEQRHGMKGKGVVYFTPTAIAVTTERGSHYVSCAPDWNVDAFRTDDKLICRMSRETFYKKFHFKANLEKARELRCIGTTLICSQKTSVMDNAQKTLWVWHPAKIPTEVGDLLCAWYKQPSMNGIVLKCLSKGEEEKRVTALKYYLNDKLSNEIETSIARSVPYRTNEFKVPSGFREVKDFEQTYFSANGRKEMESIFDQLGVGEELGSRKKGK